MHIRRKVSYDASVAKRTKKKKSIGWLFWILFILLIVVVFYVKKDTILFVLDRTNAKTILLNGKDAEVKIKELPEIQMKGEIVPATDGSTESAEQDTDRIIPAQSRWTSDKGSDTSKTPREPSNTSGHNDVPQESPMRQDEFRQNNDPLQQPSASAEALKNTAVAQTKPERSAEPSTYMRKAVVYWIRINADGKLTRQAAIRLLPKSKAPMSETLEALFKAPILDESKQGLRSLIPPETKLRSAWVKDGVAFINVSEEFQFNQYGIEGALAQLSQVVFTATEFSTVKSVQFLIEGQKKDYLGAEGVWIGSPLSRSSF